VLQVAEALKYLEDAGQLQKVAQANGYGFNPIYLREVQHLHFRCRMSLGDAGGRKGDWTSSSIFKWWDAWFAKYDTQSNLCWSAAYWSTVFCGALLCY
jgi:hypothetical protein